MFHVNNCNIEHKQPSYWKTFSVKKNNVFCLILKFGWFWFSRQFFFLEFAKTIFFLSTFRFRDLFDKYIIIRELRLRLQRMYLGTRKTFLLTYIHLDASWGWFVWFIIQYTLSLLFLFGDYIRVCSRSLIRQY